MRIIVSDTSCLIDLHKVNLLVALFHLPYSFVIPHTLFEDEFLSISAEEKADLIDLGLEVRELDSEGLSQAARYFNAHPALKLNDCFAMRMAEEIDTSILMTGDANLRTVANAKQIEVHGVLWVTDEFDRHEVVSRTDLTVAMQYFLDDPLVFLPPVEVRQRIRNFTYPR